MKRIISLILTVCTVFSGLVITSSAKATEEHFEESACAAGENYISVVSVEPNKIYTSFANNSFEFMLNCESEYQYVNVTYSSTAGVMLDKYRSDMVEYDVEGRVFDISFDVLNGLDEQCLDYHNAEFEEIYIRFEAYYLDSLVETVEKTIYLCGYSGKIYASSLGDAYAFELYLKDLRDSNSITQSEFLAAHKIITTTPIEVQGENVNFSQISESLRQYELQKQSSKVVKFYDEDTKSVETKSKLQFESYNQGLVSRSGEASTRAAVATPSVCVTRTITATNSGKTLQIYGYAYWSDTNGSYVPARGVQITILDENLLGDTTLATVYTNNNGYYTATITNKTGIIENGYDIYIKMSANSPNFQIKSGVSGTVYENGFYLTTGVTNNVKSSQSAVSYADTGLDYGAFVIHQALVAGYSYYSAMNSGSTQSVTFYYSSAIGGTEAYVDSSCAYIMQRDHWSWDSILHELGHIVQYRLGAYGTFRKPHNYIENLSQRYGKVLGVEGAWNEGWASYFSMAAQRYYNSNVVTVSNIPYVADNAISHYNTGSYEIFKHNYITGSWYGESNELGVTAVLYGMLVDSAIPLNDQAIWNLTKNSHAEFFWDFYYTMLGNYPSLLYNNALGLLMEKHAFVDKPNVNYHNNTTYTSTDTPTFKWFLANTEGAVNDHDVPYDPEIPETFSNMYDAKIVFFDSSYNAYYSAPAGYSNCLEVTITASEWNNAVFGAGGETFYWCIATCQNSLPATGYYYSSLLPINLE